jgi:hypothetical protein
MLDVILSHLDSIVGAVVAFLIGLVSALWRVMGMLRRTDLLEQRILYIEKELHDQRSEVALLDERITQHLTRIELKLDNFIQKQIK